MYLSTSLMTTHCWTYFVVIGQFYSVKTRITLAFWGRGDGTRDVGGTSLRMFAKDGET